MNVAVTFLLVDGIHQILVNGAKAGAITYIGEGAYAVRFGPWGTTPLCVRPTMEAAKDAAKEHVEKQHAQK